MQGSLLSLSLSLVVATGQGQDSYRDPYQAGQYQEQQYQPDPYQGSQYQTKGYQEDQFKSQRKQYQAEPYQAEPYQAEPYQAEPYQAEPYQAITNQEPYRPTNHYQTKKKQYQQEAYQEPYAEEEKAEPKPFAYGYGGVDSQGLQSSKTENQDKDGVVRGEYRVELPDGRTQIVSYTADHEHGYQAEVRYEGEARPVEQEPNDYRGEGGEGRVRQYPKHTSQPYRRF